MSWLTVLISSLLFCLHSGLYFCTNPFKDFRKTFKIILFVMVTLPTLMPMWVNLELESCPFTCSYALSASIKLVLDFDGVISCVFQAQILVMSYSYLFLSITIFEKIRQKLESEKSDKIETVKDLLNQSKSNQFLTPTTIHKIIYFSKWCTGNVFLPFRFWLKAETRNNSNSCLFSDFCFGFSNYFC